MVGFEKIFLWMVFGFLPAFIADSKGRNFLLWFVYGALLLPVALVHAFLLKPKQAVLDARALRAGWRKCAACADVFDADEQACPRCSHVVTPTV